MYHSYFGTPVGPEYKKKFARNVGIAALILFAFYGIWNLAVDVSKPEYPIIPQNDLLCATEWWITYAEFDKDNLVFSLRDTISDFGSQVDVPERQITVQERTRIVISIEGIWNENPAQHEELTSVIKANINDAEIMRDDVVLCE